MLLPPEEYVHPSKLIDVCAEPDLKISLEYSVFRYHHLPLYAQALKDLALAA